MSMELGQRFWGVILGANYTIHHFINNINICSKIQNRCQAIMNVPAHDIHQRSLHPRWDGQQWTGRWNGLCSSNSVMLTQWSMCIDSNYLLYRMWYDSACTQDMKGHYKIDSPHGRIVFDICFSSTIRASWVTWYVRPSICISWYSSEWLQLVSSCTILERRVVKTKEC